MLDYVDRFVCMLVGVCLWFTTMDIVEKHRGAKRLLYLTLAVLCATLVTSTVACVVLCAAKSGGA